MFNINVFLPNLILIHKNRLERNDARGGLKIPFPLWSLGSWEPVVLWVEHRNWRRIRSFHVQRLRKLMFVPQSIRSHSGLSPLS